MYGTVTLYGPTFQTVPLTLSYKLFTSPGLTNLRLPDLLRFVVLQPRTLLSNRPV